MIRIYPPIEPQLTVGEYLDRFIVKYPLPNVGKFTDSDDPQVEEFWASVYRMNKLIESWFDDEETK